MKILLDTCVWGGTARELAKGAHDVVWVGDWEDDPGDEELLRQAYREERILVTLDKDFGELAVVRRYPHAGIIRLVNFPAKEQARMCLQIIDRHGQELQAGAVVTAELGRLRIRPPEEKPQ